MDIMTADIDDDKSGQMSFSKKRWKNWENREKERERERGTERGREKPVEIVFFF